MRDFGERILRSIGEWEKRCYLIKWMITKCSFRQKINLKKKKDRFFKKRWGEE